MQMKYREVPKFETVEVVAKTLEATTGTIDRKAVGRALLTTQEGFRGKTHEIVDGDGVTLRTVKSFGGEVDEVKSVEVFVQLVGGKKSLASYKFFSGWTGENPENPGVVDLFVDGAKKDGCAGIAEITNHAKIESLVACARRMCDATPEADGKWQIVDASGRRVFLRECATNLKSNGKIED